MGLKSTPGDRKFWIFLAGRVKILDPSGLGDSHRGLKTLVSRVPDLRHMWTS